MSSDFLPISVTEIIDPNLAKIQKEISNNNEQLKAVGKALVSTHQTVEKVGDAVKSLNARQIEDHHQVYETFKLQAEKLKEFEQKIFMLQQQNKKLWLCLVLVVCVGFYLF